MAVAIIGMSCRFPGANNAEEFWDNLLDGKDSVNSIPTERWFMSGEDDLVAGYLKCPLDEFDSNFFNISPKEAAYIDPQQRIFLEVGWESLENAQIPPSSLDGSDTGIWLGIGNDDYFRCQIDQHDDTIYKVTGNTFSAAVGRLSHFLNLNGPSVAVEAACASSAVAIHMACMSLRNGECGLALAGGVTTLLETSTAYPSALVSTRCKTFDASANGFAPAEGCGVLVLKILDRALQDGDRIHAVIRGSAMNHAGKSSSFGTPSSSMQQKVIQRALAAADVSPNEVSFLETHGTGTTVGDAIETQTIESVFSNSENPRTNPIILGAVKTCIGHPLAAAGVAGVIKMILCMKHGTIPRHLHLKALNPKIDLPKIPAVIPLETMTWSSPSEKPLIGSVSSFGITGTNVHFVMEQAGASFKKEMDSAPPPIQLITVSTKDETSLLNMCQNYKEWLENSQTAAFTDIVFSMNTTRSHHPYRIAFLAKNAEEFESKLDAQDYVKGVAHDTSKQPIVFLFTGHGSQYFGMAQSLYDTSTQFRTSFDACEAAFQEHLGQSLKAFIWEDSGSVQDINRTKFSQPAIFCIQICLEAVWKSFGILPDLVLGHSIGEFAACVVSGFISFEDGMKLVSARSILVDKLSQSRMMAINASASHVQELIAGFGNTSSAWIDIATMNSPAQTVVSSSTEGIHEFKNFCLNQTPGLKMKILESQHAFHSRAMDPVLNEFESVASEIKTLEPKCMYLSGTTAKLLNSEDLTPNYWRNHLRGTVHFSAAADSVLQKGYKLFIEIGPQPVLLNFIMENNQERNLITVCPSLRKGQECWNTLLTSLSRLYVAGASGMNFENISRGRKVDLPTYPFNRKKCWASPPTKSFAIQGNGKIVHPLLGSKVRLPESTETRFSSFHSLSSTSYMKDHVVWDHAIVPATGFLEMLMAIGRDSGARTSSIQVDNLRISRPLLLDNKPKQVQTMASKPEGEPLYKVRFFTESGENWMEHAQGDVRLDEAATLEQPQNLNLELIKQTCSLTSSSASEVYEKFNKIGIQFGPDFQSVSNFWFDEGKTEMLGRISDSVPRDTAYICHPIILDAMIQAAYCFTKDSENTPFCLPVAVDSFTWYGLSRSKSVSQLFIYMADPKQVKLCTEEGEVLGVMEGITLLETNQAAFLKSLDLPSALPQFMKLDLCRIPNVHSSNVKMTEIGHLSQEEIESNAQIYSGLTEEYNPIFAQYNQLCFQYIMKALAELGWKPNIGEEFTKQTLIDLVNPSSSFDLRVLDSYINILNEEGVLEKNENLDRDSWIIAKEHTPSLEIETGLQDSEKTSAEYKFCTTMGQALPKILQGQLNPMDFMFKDNDFSNFYSEFRQSQFDTRILVKSFESIFRDVSTSTSAPLRILEVGAGSGGITQQILECLAQLAIPFQYTFTDAVLGFVVAARKKFTGNNLTFQVLDTEKDPKYQGFTPHSFDVIIASNAVHTTECIATSLRNIRHLLADSGFFFLVEIVKQFRGYALSFELLPFYWKMKDFRTSPIVDTSTWMKSLTEAGFVELVNAVPSGGVILARSGGSIEYKPVEPKKSWMVCSDQNDLMGKRLTEMLKNSGRQVISVHPGQNFQKVNKTFEVNSKRFSDFQQLSHILKNASIEGIVFQWNLQVHSMDEDIRKTQEGNISGFLNLLKILVAREWNTRLYLVTVGSEYLNPHSAPLWGMLGTFLNEYPDSPAMGINLEPDTEPNLAATQVFNRLWAPIEEIGYLYMNKELYVHRAHNFEQELPLPEISIPKTPTFKLVDATDFTFTPTPAKDLEGSQIEIAVRAVGLNFRDLLLSSGLLPVKDIDSVGLEFSGVVSRTASSEYKIGDRVMGLVADGALGTHVTVSGPELLLPLATGMSFTEAATLPVAFGTCYISLIEIGKLKAGERLLIHTATGGVGLAGIQIARYLGVEIFVTAGSRKKRNYLKHCIGLTHVYDSRSIEYSAQILADTEGQGVDLVLNTITGPGFKEASLACLAKTGRFIELSKLNIWSANEVEQLRPDVQYTILDAFEMIRNVDQDMVHTLRQLEKLFTARILKTLPHTTYNLTQLKSAFKFFHKHQHIGKVIVEIPENAQLPTRTLFSPESSYLVTGGLGGLGFQVVKFIAENGGNVVVLGRTPPNEEMQEKLKSFDGKVKVLQGDVGDLETVRRTFESVSKPLRGIFHCSGVFSNNFIANQTLESYDKVFQPKVYGTWNLHECSKTLDLTYFVVFSSIASVVGSTGLSNYTAGNRYMDTLIMHRVEELGLPGMTLNWGPWAEVGAAAGYVLGLFKSFQHFSPEVGIKSLERALQLRPTQIAIADMDMNIGETTPKLKPFLSELTGGNFGNGRSSGSRFSSGLSSMDSKMEAIAKEALEASSEERLRLMENLVELCFRTHSGMSESDNIDKDQPLAFSGLDSLIGMEVRTKLAKLLGVAIPLNLISEHTTIRTLAKDLTDLVDIKYPPKIPEESTLESESIEELRPPNVNGIEKAPEAKEIETADEEPLVTVLEKKEKTNFKTKPFSKIFSRGFHKLHRRSGKQKKDASSLA